MTIFRAAPSGTGDGSDWESPLGGTALEAAIATSPGGDTFLISKIYGESGYFTSADTDYPINIPESAGGSAESTTRVISGSCPGSYYVLHNRESGAEFLAGTQYPWKSTDPKGTFAFDIFAKYVEISGVTAKHFNNALYLRDTSGNVEVSDLSVFNAGTAVYIASTQGPVKVTGLRGKYIRKTGVRLYNNVSDVSVHNAKIDMSSVQGDGYPNGVACNVADNLELKDSYISNVGYTQSTTGVPSSNYVQGDGVTIDGGVKQRVLNTHLLRCSDRGIDSKGSDFRAVESTAKYCKYGFGIWSSDKDNKLIGCTISEIKAVRDEGACVQSQGYIKLIGCNLSLGPKAFSETGDDLPSVLRTNQSSEGHAEIHMIGGKIDIEASEVIPIIRLYTTGDTVSLTNVKINGEVVNYSVTKEEGSPSTIYLEDILGVPLN